MRTIENPFDTPEQIEAAQPVEPVPLEVGDYVYFMRAPSGYEYEQRGRITAEQHKAVVAILDETLAPSEETVPLPPCEMPRWGVRCHAEGHIWFRHVDHDVALREAEEYGDTLVDLWVHPECA